jgi:hypothetical protein
MREIGPAMSSVRSVGVPWYRREDYPRILAIMEDAAALAPSYDGWLVAAQNNEAEARRAGIVVVRVALDPETFTRWCADRGSAPTRAARVEFVNEVMRRDAGDE